MDLEDRARAATRDSVGSLLEALAEAEAAEVAEAAAAVPASGALLLPEKKPPLMAAVAGYKKSAAARLAELYGRCRDDFFRRPTTSGYLGGGAGALYMFVREGLCIPMHRGLVDHPAHAEVGGGAKAGAGDDDGEMGVDDDETATQDRRRHIKRQRTLGTDASEIYLAIRTGRLHTHVMNAWDRLHSAKAQ